jgi:cobalt-zinc-cadmium efflux system outer membrane protein
MKHSSRSWAVLLPVLGLLAPAGAGRAAEGNGLRTMTEIEAQALDANHDVRIARMAVDGARAGVMQADTRPNPTLSWNGASYSPTRGLGSGNPGSKYVDQILRVDQTFERGDKRALRVSVAQKQLLGKAADLDEQRRETLQAARNAYIDLLLAEKRVDVIADTQRSYEDSLDAAGKRVRAGDLALADLQRLKVEVLRARTEREAAAADRVHAQVALANLIAYDDDASVLRSDGRWPTFVGDVRVAARAARDLVEERPDVVSARLAVDAAAKAVELARSQRTRDITFGVQIERYPGPEGTGNTIGLGVSIPLFFGNDYRGDIGHAVSDQQIAEETAAKVRDAGVAQIATALQDLDTAERKVSTYQDGLLDAARAAANASDFAFGRGAIGIMDVLDSRRILLETRLDALAAEADYARAQAAVAAALTRVSVKGVR